MTALDDANWSPGAKYRQLLARANDLLADERRTVRDVYYQRSARLIRHA